MVCAAAGDLPHTGPCRACTAAAQLMLHQRMCLNLHAAAAASTGTSSWWRCSQRRPAA